MWQWMKYQRIAIAILTISACCCVIFSAASARSARRTNRKLSKTPTLTQCYQSCRRNTSQVHLHHARYRRTAPRTLGTPNKKQQIIMLNSNATTTQRNTTTCTAQRTSSPHRWTNRGALALLKLQLLRKLTLKQASNHRHSIRYQPNHFLVGMLVM